MAWVGLGLLIEAKKAKTLQETFTIWIYETKPEGLQIMIPTNKRIVKYLLLHFFIYSGL